MRIAPSFLLSALVLLWCHAPAFAAGNHRVFNDVEYAIAGGRALKLDLHLVESRQAPLIVWVHGGGWRSGSKSEMPLGKMMDAGYSIASVDYRLSTEAPFPAMLHDIKGAIRFLRASAAQYGYDASRLTVAGNSAGGHLAALVGVTNGVKALEGTVGGHLDQSSDVQAAISLFGASNLMTILAQSKPQGLKMRGPALQLLLGGLPEEKPELAKLASPVHHLDAKDPPLLLVHGDADPQMPPEQSQELAEACKKAGVPVELVIIPGAKHGGKVFFDEEHTALMKRFLDKALAGQDKAK